MEADLFLFLFKGALRDHQGLLATRTWIVFVLEREHRELSQRVAKTVVRQRRARKIDE